MDKIKIIYSATPDIAIESFEFFINSNDYDVLGLITQSPKASSRGQKIKESNLVKIAKENNINIFETNKISKDLQLIETIKSLKPDFIITFAFGQILSQEIIDIPKFSIINLHASLLPKYRGANPISQAIADGCNKTGITTMKTSLGLDEGDICLQKEINITPEMNVIELMKEISKISPKLLDETLKGLYNNILKSIPQDSSLATYTKKIKKEEKVINWSFDSVVLHNKIRSMYQINTNHTTFNKKIIKILKTIPSTLNFGKEGEIIKIEKDGIIVKCGNNSLKIITLKPEGKKEMFAYAWAQGARIKAGDMFE